MPLRDTVVLTVHEKKMLEWVGKQRYESAIKEKRDPGLGPSRYVDAVNHIRGAECEFACSLIVNRSWRPTIGDICSPDVGKVLEVRSTILATGRLIIKPNDDGPFALIYKKDEVTFKFMGWHYAYLVKQSYPLVTKYGDPAHFVPSSDLKSLDDVMKMFRDLEVRRW